MKENSALDMLYERPEKSIGLHVFRVFIVEKLY